MSKNIHYKSPTYNSWDGMKNRCKNKSNPSWKHYGGKGITYTPKWETFSGFLEDMGLRPENTTLDRIDSDKGYYKENCRWADNSLQNHNRKTKCVSGHKNISPHHSNGFEVSVCRNRQRVRKFVKTIEEAISIRDKLLKEIYPDAYSS